jgi:hypothetical protein
MRRWSRFAGAIRAGITIAAVVGAIAIGRPVGAQQGSAADVNAANNPLTPKITVNIHDQWAPDLYVLDQGFNALLLRGLLPHTLGGRGQLFRYTLPIVTTPDFVGGSVRGLGDLNVFDLVPFALKRARMEIGVGPQLTLPTATDDLTGTGKWQAGVAALAIVPRGWGLGGVLVTWQHSFAGDEERPAQHNLSLQPLIIYNLPQSWYLRSTATWTFDIEQGRHVIPIGAGAGKVWLLKNGTTVNAFAEPQFTVAHAGIGQPKFQVFMGVTLQFPLAGRPGQ